jgi:hypothetical protein
LFNFIGQSTFQKEDDEKMYLVLKKVLYTKIKDAKLAIKNKKFDDKLKKE